MRSMPSDDLAGVDATTLVRAHVLDIELSEPVIGLERTMTDGRSADQAWALVRLFGEPLGVDVLEIPPAGFSGDAIFDRELDRWMPSLSQILGIDRPKVSRETVCEAVRAAGGTTFSRAHQEFTRRAPRCSVVVCSRDRPEDLRRCLSSLAIQDHPDYAVWVVDNAPASGVTRLVVESFDAKMDLHYVAEPCPGLSRARNAALRSDLDGDWVAWLDDDEVADPMWLTELMRAFDGRPEVLAASGVVVQLNWILRPKYGLSSSAATVRAADSLPTCSLALPEADSTRSIRCRHLASGRTWRSGPKHCVCSAALTRHWAPGRPPRGLRTQKYSLTCCWLVARPHTGRQP